MIVVGSYAHRLSTVKVVKCREGKKVTVPVPVELSCSGVTNSTNKIADIRVRPKRRSKLGKRGIALGAARRYAPADDSSIQKSRRIYVRPRTGPQSAHLWWPAVAKPGLSMGWADPWLGWVGSAGLGRDFSVVGGLGWVHDTPVCVEGRSN